MMFVWFWYMAHEYIICLLDQAHDGKLCLPYHAKYAQFFDESMTHAAYMI